MVVDLAGFPMKSHWWSGGERAEEEDARVDSPAGSTTWFGGKPWNIVEPMGGFEAGDPH